MPVFPWALDYWVFDIPWSLIYSWCLSSSLSSLFLTDKSSTYFLSLSIVIFCFCSFAFDSSTTLVSSFLRLSISSLSFLLELPTSCKFLDLYSRVFFSFLILLSSSSFSLSISSNAFFLRVSNSLFSTCAFWMSFSYSCLLRLWNSYSVLNFSIALLSWSTFYWTIRSISSDTPAEAGC